MPMQRDLYPDDWEAIALAVKEAADWHCQVCEKQCYRPTDEVQGAKDARLILTVAHLDHDPPNCVTENLMAMCSVCHNRYDAPMRASRRQAKKAEASNQTSFLFAALADSEAEETAKSASTWAQDEIQINLARVRALAYSG